MKQKGGGRANLLSFLTWVLSLLLPSDIDSSPDSWAFGYELGLKSSSGPPSFWMVCVSRSVVSDSLGHHGL